MQLERSKPGEGNLKIELHDGTTSGPPCLASMYGAIPELMPVVLFVFAGTAQ